MTGPPAGGLRVRRARPSFEAAEAAAGADAAAAGAFGSSNLAPPLSAM
jgi:hypothetical protein